MPKTASPKPILGKTVSDAIEAAAREVITVKSPDHRTLVSSILMPDGTWYAYVQAQYRRK